MRIRLFHKLFLIIAGTALLAALAMAAVLSLSLSRGFEGYLQSRDKEELQSFAETMVEEITATGAAAAIHAGQQRIEDVLPGVFARGPGDGGVPPPPPPGEDHPPPPPGEGQPPPPPNGEHRHPPPERFSARLMLYDASGQQVFGPPPPPSGPDAPAVLKEEVRVDGDLLGTLSLVPRGPVPLGTEASFLQSQYHAAVWVTAGLLALAAVLAAWFARYGTRRIDGMAEVTRAVAQGQFGARMEVVGADELAGMAHNINAMSASLARLDTARRRWLAEISHELRTPLAALVGELDALKDGVRPLDTNAVHSLAQDAQRLTRIVQDLHFLAVSDLSGASCQFLDGDALPILRNVVNRFLPSMRALGLVLTLDEGGLRSIPVHWDAERIDQLLTILLTNCERYTDPPGRVEIKLTLRGSEVCIDVDDTAPAVAPEYLEQLFEPLFRSDEARSRVSDGSGLGLAVARAIVRAHGGSISAAMSSLGGLSVRIVLPAKGPLQ